MLRIATVDWPKESATLRLDGQVIGPWVGELRRSCDKVLADGGELTLDLTGVSFVDGEGIRLFRRLLDRHVTLTNCSPFVAEQLRG